MNNNKTYLILFSFLFLTLHINTTHGGYDESQSSTDSGLSIGKPIREIKYKDIRKKRAKMERGIILKCRCGQENKITNVRQGQSKRIKCPICGLSGKITVTKKPAVLITCPFCSNIKQIIGNADQGIYKCKHCKKEYLLASKKTLKQIQANHNEEIEEVEAFRQSKIDKGYLNINGEWISPKEQTNQMMITKGFIKYENEWLKPKEFKKAKIKNCDYEGLADYGNELAKSASTTSLIKHYLGYIAKMEGVIISQDSKDNKWICVTEKNQSGDIFAFAFEYKGPPPVMNSYYIVHGIIASATQNRHIKMSEGGKTKIKISTESKEVSENKMKIDSQTSISANNKSSKIEDEINIKLKDKTSAQLENKMSKEFTTDKIELERTFNTVNLSNVVIKLIE